MSPLDYPAPDVDDPACRACDRSAEACERRLCCQDCNHDDTED